MIFEYTNTGDLQEYLVAHSPNADFANVANSGCSQTSSTIGETEFIQMAVQVILFKKTIATRNGQKSLLAWIQKLEPITKSFLEQLLNTIKKR